MPADLIDAVIAHLEGDQAVRSAFGDTWDQAAQTGVAKFFSDLVAQVDAPWCQIVEAGESYEYMTRAPGGVVNFTSPGTMLFSIHADSRVETRALGLVVAQSLEDANLQWEGQRLMEFRLIRSQFNPLPQSGPGVPVIFNRVFFFEYVYSGSL